MFGADRVPLFLSARVICLTLAVESKRRNAANAVKSMRAIANRTEARKKELSDSKGVVFSLDFRGHIEVNFSFVSTI